MTKEQKISAYKMRISLLSGRKGISNTAIVNKLHRKIRALEKQS